LNGLFKIKNNAEANGQRSTVSEAVEGMEVILILSGIN
jgi:hypothetical protein